MGKAIRSTNFLKEIVETNYNRKGAITSMLVIAPLIFMWRLALLETIALCGTRCVIIDIQAWSFT